VLAGLAQHLLAIKHSNAAQGAQSRQKVNGRCRPRGAGPVALGNTRATCMQPAQRNYANQVIPAAVCAVAVVLVGRRPSQWWWRSSVHALIRL
jgi:hypothetical protein